MGLVGLVRFMGLALRPYRGDKKSEVPLRVAILEPEWLRLGIRD